MRDAAERAGSSTVIEQAAKVTQANLRATSDLELGSLVSDLVTSVSDLRSGETPAGGLARSRRPLLLQRVMERAQAQAALVFVAGAGASRAWSRARAGRSRRTRCAHSSRRCSRATRTSSPSSIRRRSSSRARATTCCVCRACAGWRAPR